MAGPEGEEDPFAHTRMTLGEHLGELRKRLVGGVAAIVLSFAAALLAGDHIVRLAIRPHAQAMGWLEEYWIEDAESKLAADPSLPRTTYFVTEDPADRRLLNFDRNLQWLRPAESFLFRLKVCLYASLVIGAPVLLWQMWKFVAAGLYEREKRLIRLYFPFSLVSFAAGVVFAFLVAVPYGMYFLNRGSIELGTPNISAQYFLGFESLLCLGFAVIFQLPLLMTFLAATGLMEPETMTRNRGYVVVVTAIVAAVLTPPDPLSMLIMGVPLYLLFELGVVSAKLAARRRRRAVQGALT